ncbi:putative phosphatidate phosphatase isoform X2 [Drosophila innubila]|uniref:putative phosphatidate phosphatase isoform X2 n=1 Tax=Drosophila innubila TaxID=198719 RepID=UPI00148C6F68|nr:putative phosphatidate phosphatase isoform X2 [Drosophila innubila]
MRTFKRGFFCSDLSLRYPYHECTITVPMLLLMMLLLPMLFISVVEIMRICRHLRMRKYLRNLWRSQATFSFGFIATFLTTELAKHVVGRLRPHFYSACQPRLHDGSSCSDAHNADVYVQQFYCSNRNLSTQQIRELHVSFPSAHSSLSFYSMCLLAFYVHSVWQGRGSVRVMRHILQFLLIMAAWYVSLSRVADYWHHWSDVLAGAVLGVVYATITAIYVGDLLHARPHPTGPVALGYMCAPTSCSCNCSCSCCFCHQHRHHHLHHQLLAENNNSTTSTKVHFLAAAAVATTQLDCGSHHRISDSDVDDDEDEDVHIDIDGNSDGDVDGSCEADADADADYKLPTSRNSTPPPSLPLSPPPPTTPPSSGAALQLSLPNTTA